MRMVEADAAWLHPSHARFLPPPVLVAPALAGVSHAAIPSPSRRAPPIGGRCKRWFASRVSGDSDTHHTLRGGLRPSNRSTIADTARLNARAVSGPCRCRGGHFYHTSPPHRHPPQTDANCPTRSRSCIAGRYATILQSMRIPGHVCLLMTPSHVLPAPLPNNGPIHNTTAKSHA